MRKRKMLSLALVLALIMSLVPLSGMAAEPAVFPDPAVEMQGDRAVTTVAEKNCLQGDRTVTTATAGKSPARRLYSDNEVTKITVELAKRFVYNCY